jgi:hypothetical protein
MGHLLFTATDLLIKLEGQDATSNKSLSVRKEAALYYAPIETLQWIVIAKCIWCVALCVKVDADVGLLYFLFHCLLFLRALLIKRACVVCL